MRELRRRVYNVEKRQDSFETFTRENIEFLKVTMSKLEEQMAKYDADRETWRKEFRNMMWGGFIAWAVGIGSVIVTVLIATRP